MTQSTIKEIIEAISAGRTSRKQPAALLTLAALSQQPVSYDACKEVCELIDRLDGIFMPTQATKKQAHLKTAVIRSISGVININIAPTKNEVEWLICITENTLPPVPKKLKVELTEVMSNVKKSSTISITEDAKNILLKTRSFFLSSGKQFLDEFWQQVVFILKVSAFYNGRKSVDASDCMLLPHFFTHANADYSTAIADICANDNNTIAIFDFTAEFENLQLLKKIKQQIEQPQQLTTIQPAQQQQAGSADSADLRMTFVPMAGEHFFVEGLDLLVRENDLKTLTGNEYRELKLYQQQRTGEFTEAGSFMCRMHGNCRLDFKDKPLRTSTSNFLKIKTYEGVPVLEPGQSAAPAHQVNSTIQQAEAPVGNALLQTQYNKLKNELYIALISKRNALSAVQPPKPVKNIFLATENTGLFSEKLQAAHQFIRELEITLSTI